jgi:arsenate reductase-like glutaredoxin family protein
MAQETVLSEIFGLTGDPKADRGSDPVEQLVAKALMSAREKSRAGRSGSAGESADRMFVKQLRSIARDFQDFHAPMASGNLSRNKTWKVIESLHKATNLYLEKHENADSADTSVVADSNGPRSSPVNDVDLQSLPGDVPGPSTMPPPVESIPNQVTENDPANKFQKDTIADLIDLEHPDDDGEEVEDQEFIDQADTPESVPIAEGSQTSVKLSKDAVERSLNKGKAPVREIDVADEQLAQPEEVKTRSIGDQSPSHDRQIHEYVRARHGLPLENLSIYLIPVKPSVICRAINVWSLRHISLLNVGPQRAFWATLSKLHDSNPLQLTSIHTDNVTQAFLDFVHDLDCVKELFLFERKTRCVVKSMAPKTTVTIEEINEKILKKHTKHLERLIIRNDEDMTWSLNRDSVRQISRYGSKIKEMVVGLKSANFVSLPSLSFFLR